MTRRHSLLFVGIPLIAVIAFGASIRGVAAGGESKAKGPLDLPSGKSIDKGENEDTLESIIFYGQQYEGEAFFWVLDKSSSMGTISPNGGTSLMDILKEEMTQALRSLSHHAEFGMLAFSSSNFNYKPNPVKGTRNEKIAATAWVQALVADG